MNHLWTPWRMEYIQGEKEKGCVLCEEQTRPDGTENLIVFRGQRTFIILNRFPYTSGHLMVVPYEHTATLEGLDAVTRSEIMENTVYALEILKKVYQPQGFNLGANIGEAGGAGILDHIHFHIVPRWRGDTNFMSTLADSRLLPEKLEDTYERIRAAWNMNA